MGGGFYHSFFKDDAFESHNGWFVGLGDSTRSSTRCPASGGLGGAWPKRLWRRPGSDDGRAADARAAGQGVLLQAVAAGAALELARETAESTTHTFDLNQIRYKSGAISEVDLSRTETAKLEAEQMVDSATLALRTAKVQLAFLLGQRHLFNDFTVDASQLRSTTPAGLQSASVGSLVERAMQTRPDLRAQESQRMRAAQSVALAHRQRFPDFGLGVQYTEQGSGNAPIWASPRPSRRRPWRSH